MWFRKKKHEIETPTFRRNEDSKYPKDQKIGNFKHWVSEIWPEVVLRSYGL